jgi:hypothetical protein
MSAEEMTLNTEQAMSLNTLNGLFNLLGKDLNEVINFLRFSEDEIAKKCNPSVTGGKCKDGHYWANLSLG